MVNNSNDSDLRKKYARKPDLDKMRNKLPPVYIALLKHHFTAIGRNEAQINLLVGIYGIGKRAIVNQLSEEFDYRVIHIGVPYLSKLDIYGFEYTPSIDFFTCTDEYLKFARGMVDTLKNRLNEIEEEESGESMLSLVRINDPDTEEIKKSIKRMVNKLENESKTPVLLLDEIAQSDDIFRKTLCTIVDHKKFVDYHRSYSYNINECRIVATANAPVEFKEGEKQENPKVEAYYDKFIINEINLYSGFYDYFSKLRLSPKEVFPQWLEWAKDSDNGDIHPLVLDFIGENVDIAYDLRPITVGQYDQNEEIFPIVHSTFWAWEKISNYIKSIDLNKKSINENIIFGLIGENQGKEFLDLLLKKGYGIVQAKDQKDEIDSIVVDSLDSNLPLSLVADSGFDITEKVIHSIEIEKGYKVELFDLSTKASSDIICKPVTIDILDYIGGIAAGSIKKDDELMRAIEKLKEECLIPKTVAVRLLDTEIEQRLEKAIESKTPTVILFKNFNLSADPAIQRVIFQAVLNNELCGVKINPGLFKIIITGSLSDRSEKTFQFGADLILNTVHYRRV